MKKIKLLLVLLLALSDYIKAQVITTFPHIETFDSFAICIPACGGACALMNGWQNESTDQLEIFVNTGATPTAGTGPSGDFPSGAGNYLYLEGSCGPINQKANLYTPWIDLPGIDTGVVLEMYSHQFGNVSGLRNIEVWYQSDTNATWVQFDFWRDNEDNWLQKKIDLRPFKGVDSLRLQFVFSRGFSALSDQAIDNFTFHPVMPNDAAIDSNIFSTSVCGQSDSLEVVLNNAGMKTLNSVIINWSINGTLQTPFNWTGALLPDSNETVFIDVLNLTGNGKLKVWVEKPNGILETYSPVSGPFPLGLGNDTMTTPFFSGFAAGDYFIGGATPDFNSVSEAVDSLNVKGVCGQVTFWLSDDSTFKEQIVLGTVAGASAINTITFRGTDSSHVHLYFEPFEPIVMVGSPDVTLIRFDTGAAYYHFYKLGFETKYNNALLNPGTRILYFSEAADNIVFSNCSFHNDTSYLSPLFFAKMVLASSYAPFGKKPGNIYFENNYFKVGGSGLFLGTITNTFSFKGNVVKDYTMTNGIGVSLSGSLNDTSAVIQINNNTFPDDTKKSKLEISTLEGKLEIKNNVLINTTIKIKDSYNLAGKNSIEVFNNMIPTGNAYTPIGIDLENSTNAKIYANSLIGGINISNGYGNEVYNNNVLVNGGMALQVTEGSLFASDNNNFYTSDTIVMPFISIIRSNSLFNDFFDSVKSWSAVTGFDNNSIMVNPLYNSDIDLHTCNSELESVGKLLPEITNDIDGDLRTATGYDIGADEFITEAKGVISGVDKCPGDTAVLSLGNIAGSYFWSTGESTPSIKVLNEGDYWVLYSGTCGSVSDSVTVKEVNPNAAFTVTFNGLAAAFFNQTQFPGSSYEWNLGDGTLSSDKDLLHTYASTGTYIVSLKTTNVCGTFLQQDTIAVYGLFVNGLENEEHNVKVYPNPAKDNFKISFETLAQEEVSIRVLDIQGRVLEQRAYLAHNGNNVLDFNVINSGLYFILIEGKDWSVNQKLIVFD